MSPSTASLLVVSEPESCLYTLDIGRALINYSVQKPLGVSDTPSRSCFPLAATTTHRINVVSLEMKPGQTILSSEHPHCSFPQDTDTDGSEKPRNK